MTLPHAISDHASSPVAPSRPNAAPARTAPRARRAPLAVIAALGSLAILTASPAAATAAAAPVTPALGVNVGIDLGLGAGAGAGADVSVGGTITTPDVALPGVTIPSITTPVGTTPEVTVPPLDTRVAIPGEWSPELLPPVAPVPTPDPGPHPPIASVEVRPAPVGTPTPRAPSRQAPGAVDLDADGDLRIGVTCGAMRCELIGGSVDLASGLSLDLPSDDSRTTTLGSVVGSSIKLNLRTWAHEYREIRDELGRGGCVVVHYRVRMETPAGDEVRAYAQPICGSKVTFSARRPMVTAEKVTRRIKANAFCSKACDLTPRFLMVKQGNKVLARATRVRVAAVDATRKVHTTIWQLSRAQEADILRSAGGRSGKIRYIVSARATSAGVATVGTASFRTRTPR